MPDVRQVQVTFDCADPASLSAFWREVLGYVEEPPPAGHDSWDAALEAFGVPREEWNSRSACRDPHGVGPRLFFQQVPEALFPQGGTPPHRAVKNPVHLDVRAAAGLSGENRMNALEAEAERLVAIGATRLSRCEPMAPLEAGHIVMLDPEGNEFCLD